jgi:hypothetical protein
VVAELSRSVAVGTLLRYCQQRYIFVPYVTKTYELNLPVWFYKITGKEVDVNHFFKNYINFVVRYGMKTQCKFIFYEILYLSI